MTASELARLLNGRKVGKGKWMAFCSAHPDRNRSLSIAEGRKVPVVLKCMSQNCDTRDILAAAGLRWGDLFDGKPTPAIRRKCSLQEQKERLERQLGLFIMLQVVDKPKQRYWAGAERRARWELYWTRVELEPEKLIEEFRRLHGWRK